MLFALSTPHAQGQAGPIPPASGNVPAVQNSDAVIYEVITGRGVKGPYGLSWRGFRAGSELVERGGIFLHRGSDYALDSVSGLLAFSQTLENGETARITYRKDTPEATANGSSAGSSAFDFDVWQRGQNRLLLHTFLLTNKNSGANAAPISLLQYSGNYRPTHQMEIASALYLDLRGGDWRGRSGMRLAQRMKNRTTDFALTYSRAGTQFAAADGSGLKSGLESAEANGKISLAPNLTLNATARQTTQVPDTAPTANQTATGTAARDLSSGFAYTLPANLAKIEAGRAITRSTDPDGSRVSKTLDTIRAEGTLAPRTQATLRYESQATQSSPPGETASGAYAQQTQLDLRTRLMEQMDIQGSFRNAIGTNGGQDTANLHLEATPFLSLRQLRITAGWEDKYRADGTQRTRESLIELPALPIARARISGGFRQTSSPTAERLTGILNAELTPFPFLEISGGAQIRNGTRADNLPDPDYADGYNVKVAVQPVRRLRLTGSLSRNPDRSDGTLRRLASHTIGLETQIGSLQMRAQTGLDNEYLTNRLSRTMDFNLDLHLSRYDLLSTGYQGSFLYDGGVSGTATYLLSYSRRFGSAFDLGLSGKMIRNAGDISVGSDKTEYKAEAKIGIHF